MQHIIDVFVTAVTWTWNAAGWWLVVGVAAIVAAVGVAEWRRR